MEFLSQLINRQIMIELKSPIALQQGTAKPIVKTESRDTTRCNTRETENYKLLWGEKHEIAYQALIMPNREDGLQFSQGYATSLIIKFIADPKPELLTYVIVDFVLKAIP